MGDRENYTGYLERRKRLSGVVFETALPNEYLVQVGRKDLRPLLGGRKVRLFRKFIRVPASVQTLHFATDNANMDYQGIGIEGFASWRIDPVKPEVSLRALDFFNDDDPMARTNRELTTICVEAVRHVIANMTIDEAMKKKEDIGGRLKEQLASVEERWGIVFDQVGIEKVTVKSAHLFEELQSQYRDRLRLDVTRTKIATDQEIATEQSLMKEKTQLKAIETDNTIERSRIESAGALKKHGIDEDRAVALKEREVREDEFRRETAFRHERDRARNGLDLLRKELALASEEAETKLLEVRTRNEALRAEIDRARAEVDRLRREIDQAFSQEYLQAKLVEALPQIFASISIDNYSVLESPGEGGFSPVGRVVQEILYVLKNSGVAWPRGAAPAGPPDGGTGGERPAE